MDVLPPVALGPASSPWTAPPPKSRPDSSKASFAPAFPNLQHGLFLHCVSSSDLDLCRVAAHMDAHTSVKPSVGVPMDAPHPFVKHSVGVPHGCPHPLSLPAGAGTVIHNLEIHSLDETRWFRQTIFSGSSCGRWKPEKKVGSVSPGELLALSHQGRTPGRSHPSQLAGAKGP